MPIQPGANLSGAIGTPTRPENVEVPHYDSRNPSTTDWNYPIGKEWINIGNSIWKLLSILGQNNVNTANWVEIASASGNVLSVSGTTNQITSTNTNGSVVLSVPATFIAPGSIAATTTITAILGNITATNGNIVLGTAGNKLVSTSVGTTTAAGANSIGSVTLVSGTATVATTAVTASSLIITWRQSVGASTALGNLTIGTITANTSFVINAATQGTPGTPLAADVSVVGYMIIN